MTRSGGRGCFSSAKGHKFQFQEQKSWEGAKDLRTRMMWGDVQEAYREDLQQTEGKAETLNGKYLFQFYVHSQCFKDSE